jgi:hypothetical protein
MHADAATTALFGMTDAEVGLALSKHLPDAHVGRIIRS